METTFNPNIIAYQGALRLHNWVDGSSTSCKVIFSIPHIFNPFKRFVTRDKDRAGQRFQAVLTYDGTSEVAWKGELLLLKWSSSGAVGHTATFMVAPENGENPFSQFQAGKTGSVFACAMVEIADDETPVVQDHPAPVVNAKIPKQKPEIDNPKPYGQLASLLYKRGWLVHTSVLCAIGSVDEFRDYVRSQPCCINDKRHDERIILRSVEEGSDDPWSIVPVCFLHKAPGSLAKSWKRKLAQEWARDRLCEILDADDGLGTVDPQLLYDWAFAHDVHSLLPDDYKQSFGI